MQAASADLEGEAVKPWHAIDAVPSEQACWTSSRCLHNQPAPADLESRDSWAPACQLCQAAFAPVAGMLDVQQIFGRAGRPQFEDEGLGVIITQHAQLAHYLGMLTHQTPIESQFTKGLVDNLNAEIVLGGWGWL